MESQKLSFLLVFILISSFSVFPQKYIKKNVTISLNVEGEGEIDICEDIKLEIFHSDGRGEEMIFQDCKGKAPQLKGEEPVEVRFSGGNYQMRFPKVPPGWISYKRE